MNGKNDSNECASAAENCGGRREFLVKATTVAGGLGLILAGLSNDAAAQKDAVKPDEKASNAQTAADETYLKLDEKSPLAKVGGFQTIETMSGKIVVARTAADTFVALSAVCPHKGGPINYDEKSGQFFCPWHNSRFDKDGKVVKPPAKTDLKKYSTGEAVIVNLKTS